MNLHKTIDLYKSIVDHQRPFEGEFLTQLKDYYRIGLTWSTNALEGNTLTESETKVLLEDGLTVGGKPLGEIFEAIGHAKAYDFMFTLLNERSIRQEDILTLHRLFYEGIDKIHAGEYRKLDVFITGSRYPVTDPNNVPAEMDELCRWIVEERDKYHPVTFAAQLHKRFVSIHPFMDGNGRIARLLMNTALLQDGYFLAIIPPVLRHEYIELLEIAHEDGKPFELFIAQRVLESYKEVMRLLHISLPKPEGN